MTPTTPGPTSRWLAALCVATRVTSAASPSPALPPSPAAGTVVAPTGLRTASRATRDTSWLSGCRTGASCSTRSSRGRVYRPLQLLQQPATAGVLVGTTCRTPGSSSLVEVVTVVGAALVVLRQA